MCFQPTAPRGSGFGWPWLVEAAQEPCSSELRGEVTALSHCQRETFFCLLISVSMQIPVAEAPAHLQKCLLLSDVSCQGKAALFIGSQS